MFIFTASLISSLTLLFAAVPTSTNFQIKAYQFGNGGGTSTSATYSLTGLSGEPSGTTSSATYGQAAGLTTIENAFVPAAPTITNPASYYNKLKIVLNPGNNPSDTKFAIAISPDAFATTTNYIKSDNTVGSTLAITDYQTYSSVAWGGASGFLVLGLQAGTTYTVKVKAMEGKYTESKYGPTASAATISPSLTFSLATTLTATPPFSADFASLPAGTVTDANADVTLGLTSNANNGGMVIIIGQNGGLSSAAASFTLSSSTADLSLASSGYGAIVTATGQSSGGPMTSLNPFNGVSNNVGAITTSPQQIVSTSAAVTTGTATVRLKAKAQSITPASNDYQDKITFVAAMNF